MKLRTFKTSLYTIIIILSMHGYAYSQDTLPNKEKNLEQKMKQLELQLKNMQQKLDSLKVKQKGSASLNNYDYTYLERDIKEALKPLRNRRHTVPKPPVPPIALDDITRTLERSFQGLNKAMNFNFDYDDNKLAEKIKSGEVKEKIKNYSKTYSIGMGNKLQIDNRYGKVTINTWNKNEFKVDVEIRAIADEDDQAQKLLNGVTINDNKDGQVISFTTNISNQGNFSRRSWSNADGVFVSKLEVNYNVYMPSKNALDVTNKYGGTVLPDFDGKLTINSLYGSFTAKALTNVANDITANYGSANIESLKGSDLKVYYGSLILGMSDNLNATISYSSAKIDKIKTSANITLKYSGGLRIGDLDKNLKNLLINSAYSSVMVGMNSEPNCDFDVSVHYGSFSYGNHKVNVTTKTPVNNEQNFNPTKTYKGHLGKGNADKLITIKSTFGNVKFD